MFSMLLTFELVTAFVAGSISEAFHELSLKED
jgi:hypothetical protein